jgi:hypothetical protein
MISRQLRISHALALSAMALTFSVSAQAGASRTFVSTIGNDSNTSANCSATANCRTFGAALSVTNAGGEVVVVTSGGYGPATISQPVIITAIGIDASISVTTTGGSGLTINTPGNVTLIGLNLHGEATGYLGINIQQVGFLRLYNTLIENFTHVGSSASSGIGVYLPVPGKIAIHDSTMNDNAQAGLFLANGSSFAYVLNTTFDNNGAGVEATAGEVTIADSSAEYNFAGFVSDGGTLTLVNDRAMFNSIGLDSASGGSLSFANCLLSNNTTSYQVAVGSTMAGTSPGTSLIAPGQATSGALSAPLVLQ